MARGPGHDDDDDALRGRAAIEEMASRLGGVFGPLGEALGRLVETAEKAQRSADGAVARSGLPEDGSSGREVTIEQGPLRASFEYRARVGGHAFDGGSTGGAKSRAREEPGAAPPSPGAPRFECWTDNGLWTLTAEVPGATEAGLRLRVEAGRLTVDLAGDPPWRIDTPVDFGSVDGIEAHLRHGILELTARLSK